jgi:serine/threonine protein kinase
MSDELDNMARRRSTPELLQRSWDELCAEYLPFTDGDSIWRYSRSTAEDDLDQGWKLHVSATILNAPQILRRIARVLIECGVQFKAARSLDDVLRLNSGLLNAYSQVGKIITVYPRSDDEAVHLAKDLHQRTYRFKAPSVPFDLRLADTANVYYRYGAFKKVEIERNGAQIPAVISPSGELVPDVRENPKPDWVCDPFQNLTARRKVRNRKSVTANSFPVVRALVQRGKGGVYQAIDLQSNPPRVCLLKEGRRHGEMSWDGRDGAWRVRNEERVLSRLSRSGIKVPQVYSRFQVDGNVYLAMEFVDGESLQTLLLRKKRRLSIQRVLSLGIEIATFLDQMHRAGWAWRDCKPHNLIVNSKGRLVPVDFEGAEQINRPDPLLWGTPPFMPRAARERNSHNGLTDDLYALGAILFLLLSGRIFDDAQPTSIAKLRRNVPLDLRRLVESLLATDPQTRPSAQQVQTQLTSILLKRSQERMMSADVQAT